MLSFEKTLQSEILARGVMGSGLTLFEYDLGPWLIPALVALRTVALRVKKKLGHVFAQKQLASFGLIRGLDKINLVMSNFHLNFLSVRPLEG